MPKKIIELFTDGGCRGNPGMGAWGACLRLAGQEKVLWGFVPETTNNRMELTAALRGLEALKRPSVVRVISDSRYLRDGMTQWLAGWQRRGWRTAAGDAVKNKDIWERLVTVAAPHEIQWEWVRGHSGHIENERVDALLNLVMDQYAAGGQAQEGEGWL
ncbi:MAG: ribonuclease HI [Acidithiobacillus ferrivorans]|jgi:ribonuclease HI|uniref:Ribonuclease H n=1 Tax=Acidithiobacillus ferrivorans TaxID=160808 RepID=A0A060URI8_9PROT|nr:ribonuclease HI [Acidithiobacillus ferrivorans]MBN6740558.1 ribonuclease HI [Acidithiobacillus sp. MC6.1]OCB02394.1 ribonuclease HI [Acidithiobacillus ferrivorans]QQD73308.1 ribonuclease HI [Acidithiobacillus ferrivorans]CDQ11000.1 Ribonuclease HI (RNase HI) (Ribonuclease H) (RNase H) [Acidithiobacillus ferrivorans]